MDTQTRPPSFTPALTTSSSFTSLNSMNSEDGICDSRLVLKMFRSMGSAQGVTENDIEEALLLLNKSNNRTYLEAQLHEMFLKADVDESGFLSLKEFERMVEASTIMQEAIKEIDSLDADLRVYEAKHYDGEVWLQRVVSTAIVLNILVMMVSTDLSPSWIGWLWLESCFVIIFVFEIAITVFYVARHSIGWPKPGLTSKVIFVTHGFRRYCSDLMNVFDLAITICASLDVLAHALPMPGVANLTSLRILRLLRLARIVKLARSSKDLQLLVAGLASCFRAVMYSCFLIVVLCLILSILLRQNLASDEGNSLRDIFPSVPTTMVVIGRCLVLRSEGACLDSDNQPLFTRLSGEMGLLFQVPWIFSELFIILGLLNVVTSIFLVNTMKEENKLDRYIGLHHFDSDQAAMMRLETLLRSLIHPKRKGNTENSQKNIANVVSDVQRQYPEIATKIPDLARSVSKFAMDIQSSKGQYKSAMDRYNADETTACVQLRLVPSAKTFFVAGEEKLFIDGEDMRHTKAAGLNLTFAPLDACEVLSVQEEGSISELLEEATQVMNLVKSKLLPGSDWARDLKAGKSPEAIWHQSNNLCDQAVDPGPKGLQRAREKVEIKYKGRCEQNRDYARLGLIYDRVAHLLKALKNFLKFRLNVDGFQVSSIENRFANPTALGWEDITLHLKVRLPSGRCHIMEVQLQLRGLTQVRDNAHEFYSVIRGLLPPDVLSRIIDQLTTNDSLDLNMSEKEWLSCLQNPHVTALLDELQIPRDDWMGMVQAVDADGNGSVSSTELREGLTLCKSPLRTRDIIAIKLKVDHMSDFFVSRLDKQLHELQGMLTQNTNDLLLQVHGMLAGPDIEVIDQMSI